MTFPRFPDVSVDVPYPDEEGSTPCVSMMTALFRGDAYIGESVGLCLQLTGKSGPITVLSAGCSIGAEPDSVLGALNEYGYEGRANIKGIDANDLAIQLARLGIYSIGEDYIASPSMKEKFEEKKERLRHLGYSVFYGQDKSYLDDKSLKCLVSSRTVRAGHDVSFEQHDVLKPLPLDQEADLVLANNLLFHLPTNAALEAVTNLADVLSARGILSIGDDGLAEQLLSGGFVSRVIKGRKERITDLLDIEFGLKPLAINYIGQAIMFARPESHAQIGLNGEPIRID